MQTEDRPHTEMAVVTGGGGEIGREICLRLARAGAAVVVVDIAADTAEQTAQVVTDAGGRAHAVAVDVTDRAAVAAALDDAQRRYGPVTISVCAHGIGPGAPFLDISEELWDHVLSVNLTGTLILGQEAGRRMVASGYGRIVNVGSVAARLPSNEIGCYMVSKGAIEALTRVMAFELGPHGVTVNTLAPGAVLTKLLERMQAPGAGQARIARTSIGRLGAPADIAAAIVYLASRDASYITGTVVTVDGGYSIGGIRAAPQPDPDTR